LTLNLSLQYRFWVIASSMNLKKLQSIGRRRLGLEGEIEFVRIPGAAGRVLGSSAVMPSLQMKHTISYTDASSLDEADVYHEMCRAKLYELGFKTVENAALVAMRDCANDDPKYIFDANSAVVIVSEVYSSMLLYTYFQDESAARRSSTILRFESSDALTSLHTLMGFWGVAGLAYYKLSAKWAGKEFPSKRVDAAVDRASDGKAISGELSKIESILAELPRIETGKLQKFSDQDQLGILSCIVRLFSAKTGIACE
jgi:hypothetical protein